LSRWIVKLFLAKAISSKTYLKIKAGRAWTAYARLRRWRTWSRLNYLGGQKFTGKNFAGK
jgi:hypothetical protein